MNQVRITVLRKTLQKDLAGEYGADEREGNLWVNLKLPADWGAFFRSVYPSVLPAYHMNKEHWSSVILDGSIPDGEIVRMTEMSFQLTE